MGSGYHTSLVFRYLDTFPRPAGVPQWPQLIPEPTPEQLEERIASGQRIVGDPDECAAAVQKYADVGCDQIIFGVLASTPAAGRRAPLGRAVRQARASRASTRTRCTARRACARRRGKKRATVTPMSTVAVSAMSRPRCDLCTSLQSMLRWPLGPDRAPRHARLRHAAAGRGAEHVFAAPWEATRRHRRDPPRRRRRATATASSTSPSATTSACRARRPPAMSTVWYDTVATLGFLAAATRRVRLLSYVYVAPYRHPLVTAKAFATLDALSGGRVILGVGAGHLEASSPTLGVDFAPPRHAARRGDRR